MNIPSDINGYLVEVFGMPAFFYPNTDIHPMEEESEDGFYYYIKINATDVNVEICPEEHKRFTGSALAKPEFYRRQQMDIMEHTETVGVVIAFSKILSSQVDWAVLDRFSIDCLHDKSNPITLGEYQNNRIIRYRSQHHSTATMSALTDALLYNYVEMCHHVGHYVAKTFNHYNPANGEEEVSNDKFYVEFSADNTTELSHIHLPYEYWGRLDVPIIEHLSPEANLMQPNSSVLLKKILDSVQTHKDHLTDCMELEK